MDREHVGLRQHIGSMLSLMLGAYTILMADRALQSSRCSVGLQPGRTCLDGATGASGHPGRVAILLYPT